MAESIGLLFLIFFIGSLYFLPSIVAREKENFLAILVLNFFLGWTFLRMGGSVSLGLFEGKGAFNPRHQAVEQ